MIALAFMLVVGLLVGWFGHQAWLDATNADRLEAMRGLPRRHP